jgi:hypothetical protein
VYLEGIRRKKEKKLSLSKKKEKEHTLIDKEGTETRVRAMREGCVVYKGVMYGIYRREGGRETWAGQNVVYEVERR